MLLIAVMSKEKKRLNCFAKLYFAHTLFCSLVSAVYRGKDLVCSLLNKKTGKWIAVAVCHQ